MTRWYPRLVEAVAALRFDGLEIVGADGRRTDLGKPELVQLWLLCRRCEARWPMDFKTYQSWAKSPRTFRCRHCQARPRFVKTAAAFLTALLRVDRADAFQFSF